MKGLEFQVGVPGFLLARTVGRICESATLGGLSGLRLRELPDPTLPGDLWVELDILGCGVCGTDLANLTYRSSPILEPFGSFPAVLGHEILARVRRVGDRVTRVYPGQRVVVDPMLSCLVRGFPATEGCRSCAAGRPSTCERAGEEGPKPEGPQSGTTPPLSAGLTIGYHRDLPGGWGERMVAHEAQLFPVDPRISNRAAVLIEPLAIGVHGALHSPPAEGDEVLVIGSGPIALATIWAIRALGFRGELVAQVKREGEVELALALGASRTVSPGLEAREALVSTGASAYQPILGEEVFAGGGFAQVFDCVGSASSLDQALRFTAPRGRITMLGCAAEIRKLDLTLLWAHELELVGYVGYGMEEWRGERRHTFEITQELLLAGSAPVEALVTHVFPLRQYRNALSAAMNRSRSGAIKVVLTPDEGGLAEVSR